MKQLSKTLSQSDKFKAMAKEVEATGDEKDFDGKLKSLVLRKTKPTRVGSGNG